MTLTQGDVLAEKGGRKAYKKVIERVGRYPSISTSGFCPFRARLNRLICNQGHVLIVLTGLFQVDSLFIIIGVR